jgi:hypothetical protein
MTPCGQCGRTLVPVLVGVALGGALAWLLVGRAEPAAPPETAAPVSAAAPGAALPQPPSAVAAAPAPLSATGAASTTTPLSETERLARKAQWTERLARARDALQGYQQSARYPHASRPASEHPDQMQPFAPVAEERPLRMPGGTATLGVKLVTSQERTFLTGNESTRVTVALLDDTGKPLPLRVTRAVLHEVTQPGRTASTAEVVLPVNDQGQAGDAVANDGTFTGWVQPALQGFGSYAGLLRLDLYLESGGQPGFLFFDFIVSPETAARWLPGVRETIDQGSLAFFLPLEVLIAGRYVVSARVDDASGRTFAVALFNDELPRGKAEIRLPVFGRLVHDEQPQFPLKLRDVEAFLLKADTYPDRVMLPRLAGAVHTSRVYAQGDFANAAWVSDERDRYLTELSKDVAEAEQALRDLGP